jgi:hypothetical protein
VGRFGVAGGKLALHLRPTRFVVEIEIPDELVEQIEKETGLKLRAEHFRLALGARFLRGGASLWAWSASRWRSSIP